MEPLPKQGGLFTALPVKVTITGQAMDTPCLLGVMLETPQQAPMSGWIQEDPALPAAGRIKSRGAQWQLTEGASVTLLGYSAAVLNNSIFC